MKQLTRQVLQEMMQKRRTLPLKNRRIRSGTIIHPNGSVKLDPEKLKTEFDQQPSQKRKQRKNVGVV